MTLAPCIATICRRFDSRPTSVGAFKRPYSGASAEQVRGLLLEAFACAAHQFCAVEYGVPSSSLMMGYFVIEVEGRRARLRLLVCTDIELSVAYKNRIPYRRLSHTRIEYLTDVETLLALEHLHSILTQAETRHALVWPSLG